MAQLLIVQTLVNGSTYALLALGLSLIFGVGRLINMAHTAFFVVAAFGMLYFTRMLDLNTGLSVFLTVVGTALLGALVYRFLIDRVRQHPQAVLLITVALALAFQSVLYLRFGGLFRSLSPLVAGSTTILGVIVSNQYFVVVGAVVVILVILWLVFSKTKVGISVRAVANDAEIANLMGINVPRTLMTTMAVAAGMAAVAATLAGGVFTIYPPMWANLLAIILVIVVLGGLGSIKGSVIGAFIIAFVENLVLVLGLSSYLLLTFDLLAMVIVLVVRPGGLFGIILEEERL
jgi:branched-chain amino acid transport system permease protein